MWILSVCIHSLMPRILTNDTGQRWLIITSMITSQANQWLRYLTF